MPVLPPFTKWKVKKKYVYGLVDLEKTVNGVTYKIVVDPINSGTTKMRGGAKTASPKKARYIATIDYGTSGFVIRRGVKTKQKAKDTLNKIKLKIDKMSSQSEIKEYLSKEARKGHQAKKYRSTR